MIVRADTGAGEPPVLRAPSGVLLRHAIRGRARFYVPQFKGHEAFVPLWTRAVLRCPGVQDVVINPACGSVTIYHSPSMMDAQQLHEWMTDHLPTPKTAADKEDRHGGPQEYRHAEGHLPLMVSTLAVVANYFFKPLAAPVLPLVVLFTGADIWKKAYHSFVGNEGITQDILDGAVLTLLLLQGDAGTATVSVWLSTLTDALRMLATSRSTAAFEALLPTEAEQVWVRQDSQRVQQSIAELSAGSTIVLYPGDRVPVDGTVVGGNGTVYEPGRNGRDHRQSKESGDLLLSGSFVADGHLYVAVNRIGKETAHDAILRRAFARRSHETDLQQDLVSSAGRFRPLTLGGAGLAALVRGGRHATTVLMIDYESGIKIAAPTAIIVAMLRAAAQGIVVQDGRGLERLGAVDTFICTLSGPLLSGRPHVRNITKYAPVEEAQVLAWAASAEARFGHGIARAIAEAARQREIAVPFRSDVEGRLGGGVKAMVDHHEILVGAPDFLKAHGVIIPQAVLTDLEAAVSEGLSPVPVGVDGRVVASLLLTDDLRPEAQAVIAALRTRIPDVRLLTGGHEHRARAIAERLHIESFVAKGPHAKAQLIRDLRRTGRTVAVMGHSTADAEALEEASVAIALSSASPVVRDLAHLVLTSDLLPLPFAYDLSRDTRRVMVQDRNLIIAANTTALVLTALGWLSPQMTSLLTDGSTVLATLNSMRPALSVSNAQAIS
ncbi:HAD-IC family P-type ATPase [Nitrospira sp. Nam74]